MQCKLCTEDRKLVDSHIIPRCFYEPMIDGASPPVLITDKPYQYPKRRPIGIYDPNILCRECEEKTQLWDDYACRILRMPCEKMNELKLGNGRLVGYFIDNVDYFRLKMFFISLIWRAAVSNLSEFSEVRAASYTEQARQMLLSNDPGSPDTFAVILGKFDNALSESVILRPFSGKITDYNLNCVRIDFHGFSAVVKTDKRRTPSPLSELALAPDRPLYIILRKFSGSKELRIMLDIVKNRSEKI